MQLSIVGKNLEVTQSLREYVERKIGRLDRYLPNISDARVELSVENTRAAKDSQVAQVTLHTKQATLRAQEATSDMFASIDDVLEKLQNQIIRFKGRRWAKRVPVEAEAEVQAPLEEEITEEPLQISRIKRFRMIPMDEEEAAEQMELLGHDFFVFYNTNESQINVIYRRRSGDYGLIQPEMA